MMVKIYLDPGHGGSDPGAVGHGIREKDITLKIASKIKDYLQEYDNVSVRMSRTSDISRSLSWRTNDANRWGADYLISIHINAGGGSGFESYIYNGGVSNKTRRFQDIIHKHIAIKDGLPDRGKKRANFHMVRESRMPAILTENGFIDTKSNANKMKTQSWINDVARGHTDGVVDAFKLKKKDIKSEPINNASFYTVKRNDTLWSIANKFEISVNELKDLNNLKSNTIYPNQKLKVNKSNEYVEVLVNDLWVYDKPDWDAKTEKVNKGEVFTVRQTLLVNDSTMYQLKSGLYITGWHEYVRFYTK